MKIIEGIEITDEVRRITQECVDQCDKDTRIPERDELVRRLQQLTPDEFRELERLADSLGEANGGGAA